MTNEVASQSVDLSSGKKAHITLAAVIGTLLDFTDNGLATGPIAVFVWAQIFFSKSNPVVAVALSIAAVASTWLVRPIGAFIFGSVADRRGRRYTLIWTLVLVTIGTIGVAFVPTYSQIGILAPVLVILARVIFGFGLGGEFGGATSWIAEVTAKSKWRIFATSWIQTMVSLGGAIASYSVAFTRSIMTASAFASYGWRILFIIMGLGAIIGLVLRYRSIESPLFRAVVEKQKAVRRVSGLEVFKRRKLTMALLIIGAFPLLQVVAIALGGFLSAWLKAEHLTIVQVALIIGNASLIATAVGVIGALFATVINKKKMLIVIADGAVILSAVLYLYLVSSANYFLISVAVIVMYGVPRFAATLWPGVMSENFTTSERAAGVGLSYQLTVFFGAGVWTAFLTPYLLVTFNGPKGAAPYQIGLYIGITVVSMIITAIFLRDRKTLPADDAATAPTEVEAESAD